MGRVIMIGPVDEASACPFCLMAAKQKQWEMYQDQIKAGYEASGEKVTVIPWPAALDSEILDGAYRAVPGDAPQLGLVAGLCWNHVAGIGPTRTPSGLVGGVTGLPAGFRKGKG